MIKEITEHIEAKIASLSMSGAGRNLYCGRRPQSAPDVSTVVEEPFPDPADPTLADKVEKTFRIECRGDVDNYFSARDVADSIYTALRGTNQITLPVVGAGPTYVVNLEATAPSSIGPDGDKHRPRIIIYLYCTTQEI